MGEEFDEAAEDDDEAKEGKMDLMLSNGDCARLSTFRRSTSSFCTTRIESSRPKLTMLYAANILRDE
jgi:hypothetical protein